MYKRQTITVCETIAQTPKSYLDPQKLSGIVDLGYYVSIDDKRNVKLEHEAYFRNCDPIGAGIPLFDIAVLHHAFTYKLRHFLLCDLHAVTFLPYKLT